MWLVAVAVLALVSSQAASSKSEDVTLMKANLGGSCSADFTVKDADGKPVYAASVHVLIRYGFAGVKHADLEVGTSSEGKARIEGMPNKARPMTYDIKKDDKKTEVTQDVADMCRATFEVALK